MHVMARHPQDVAVLYARWFNAGDPNRLWDLYAPDAVLAVEPGAPVRGAGLRQALAVSLARRIPITVTTRRVLIAGDTAQVTCDWWLQGTDPQNRPVSESGRAVDVLRRGDDRCWRMLIDNAAGARL